MIAKAELTMIAMLASYGLWRMWRKFRVGNNGEHDGSRGNLRVVVKNEV
jgi:hypothetical protein